MSKERDERIAERKAELEAIYKAIRERPDIGYVSFVSFPTVIHGWNCDYDCCPEKESS
jgi:hypothetical protein